MHPRQMQSGINMFMVVAVVLVGAVLIIAGAEFAYSRFLHSEADQKAAALQAAQASVSQDTVQGFLRLKNRLTASQTILNNHVVMSQFFTDLEALTLNVVRFTALNITVNPDHTADIKMSGVAKDFNALAAQSAAFATDKRIKQAIFSGINADKTGVTFSVSAKLDPSLITLPPVGFASTTAPTGS